MRIVLLYPPPWKITAQDEAPDRSDNGSNNSGKNNKSFSGDQVIMPYGLLSLAAQAKRKGHDVTVLNLYGFPWIEVSRIIRSLPAELFGLSCFTDNRRGTLSVAHLIREVHTEAYVVVGGPHASALPREMLEHCDAIDGIVIGEGESTFHELIEQLERKTIPTGIAGMAWKTEDGVVIGPPRKRIHDLDSLPSPFEYFEGHVILSARGCVENCTFCGSPALWGRKVRFHSAKYTLNMIEQVVRARHVKCVWFKDETFTLNRNRVLQICDGIIKRNLNFLWSCDTRVDAVNEEVLLAMRKAGCQRISIGVESGSPEILRSINKRITPEKILSATRLIKKFGFDIRYYLIGCNRGETAETLQATIDLIRAGKPNRFSCGALLILPGTKEFEIAESQGLANAEMYFSNDYPYFTLPPLDEDKMRLREIFNWIDNHNGKDFWDYDVAEREDALKLLPDLHASQMDLGVAYFKAGKFEKAEEHIRLAMDMGYPLAGVGYTYLACIAVERREFKKAVSALGKAKKHGDQWANENLKMMYQWLDSGGLQRGKVPRLVPNRDYMSLVPLAPHWLKQPFMPGPITVPKVSSDNEITPMSVKTVTLERRSSPGVSI